MDLISQVNELFNLLKPRVEAHKWDDIQNLVVNTSVRSPTSDDLITERLLWKKILQGILDQNPLMLTVRLVEDRLLFGVLQRALASIDEEDLERDAQDEVQKLTKYFMWREVKIPLVLMLIEHELTFGNVTFRPFTDADYKKEWWTRVEANLGTNATKHRAPSYAAINVAGGRGHCYK